MEVSIYSPVISVKVISVKTETVFFLSFMDHWTIYTCWCDRCLLWASVQMAHIVKAPTGGRNRVLVHTD